jgi:hypothetical protein
VVSSIQVDGPATEVLWVKHWGIAGDPVLEVGANCVRFFTKACDLHHRAVFFVAR